MIIESKKHNRIYYATKMTTKVKKDKLRIGGRLQGLVNIEFSRHNPSYVIKSPE